MNNKIVSTKTTSAIFLAIVLVTGTITALSFQSSFIVGAQAQQYYGMDDSYGYSDYRDDKDKKYDSYGYSDYKPQYPSYGETDDRDKSKNDSSDIINKIKCTTNNINVNGDITGDVNLGNKGQAPTADANEGYLGAYSSGDERYYDGYNNNKKDKGFECIINNNNNNVVSGGGNVTEPLTCEECFTEFLTPEQIANFSAQINPESENLTELCLFLSNLSSQGILEEISVIDGLLFVNVSLENAQNVVECLKNAGFNFIPIP